jgi:hypothetical protein
MRAYRGRRTFEIKDPVFEPFWSGTRVLAHVAIQRAALPPAATGTAGSTSSGLSADVALIEPGGTDLVGALPDVIEALASGVFAREAIIDGVITRQVSLDGVGAATVPQVRGRLTDVLVRSDLHFDIEARGPIEARIGELGLVDGFVAVDLLRVDGTALLDVPLLERKRLLESVIGPGPLLRLSGHVRPPLDPWLATWKSMGLRGGILKAANSRYRPNDDSIEWRIVERIRAGRDG